MKAKPQSRYEELLGEELAQQEQRAIAEARRDPNAFNEYVLIDPTGQRIEQSGCHVELQDFFTAHRRAMALIHRDSGKTTQIVGRMLFELGRNPELRLKVLGVTAAPAAKRVVVARNYIEHSPRLRQVFPHLQRSQRRNAVWASGAILVQRQSMDIEPTLEACGLYTGGVGSRSDGLIVDDPCDWRNAVASPAARVSGISAFDEVWMNTMTPSGFVWIIATPWHKDDLTGEIQRRAARPGSPWQVLRRPVQEAPGGILVPVWPEVWSHEKLTLRRAELKKVAFARGFLLVPLDDETCPLLPFVPLMKAAQDPGWLWEEERATWPRVTAVDPAIRRGKKSSRTAIITVALAPNGRRWVDARCSFVGHLSSPETARKIVELQKRSGAQIVYVETNAYQQSLIEWIEAAGYGGAGVPLQAFVTGGQKLDPEIGVPGLAGEMEAGSWALPMGPVAHQDECPCVLCQVADEAAQWPVGTRDDALMAWWIAGRACARLGVASAAEEAAKHIFAGEGQGWLDTDQFDDLSWDMQ